MRHRASVIILEGNKVLLFHRFNNGLEYYSVPGGGIEDGESPIAAAIREVKEETNLDIVVDKELDIQTTDVDKERPEAGQFVNHIFLATGFAGDMKMGDEEIRKTTKDNSYELQWVIINDLGKMPVSKDIRDSILDAVRKISPNIPC